VKFINLKSIVAASLIKKNAYGVPDMSADMESFLDWAENEWHIRYPGMHGALGINYKDTDKIRVKHKIVNGVGSLLYSVKGWDDTKIVITFTPPGKVKVSGSLRGKPLDKDFLFNTGLRGISGGVFSDIISYIEKSLPEPTVKFQVVDSEKGSRMYDSVEDLLKDYESEGSGSFSAYPEVGIIPNLKNMAGPMHSHREGDTVIIRYEDWKTYDLLSK